MRRSLVRLGTAVVAAGLALGLAHPAVEAQSAAAAKIIDSGVPPQCSGTDTYCFSPGNVTVAVGGKVTWTSSSRATHTVTADDSSWDSGNIASGGSFSHTFTSPGTVHYHCSYHSFMTATVTVTGSAPPGSTSAAHTSTSTSTHTTTSTASASSSHSSGVTTPPPAAASTSAASAPVANAAGSGNGGGSSPTASPDSGALAADAGSSGSGSGGSGGVIAAVVVIVVVVLGGGALWLRRRAG